MITSTLLSPVLIISAVLTCQPEQNSKPAAQAQAILQLLIDGKYQEFVAAGDDAVRSKITALQAERIRGMWEFQLGKYESVDAGTVTPVEKYNSVRFVLQFERGTQAVRIVVDEQGRMAGFWVDAQQATVAYEPPAYVDRKAFREEKVTVSAGQFPLAGILTLPINGKRHPGLVLVHGSGPHDADETIGPNKPFRDLAEGLSSRGIVVLRYEKRTQAHPTARKAEEWTLADETIDDALAAAELLRGRPEVDPQYVYVLGHSQGGLAAPYIAQRDAKLGGIIVLAGSARPVLDLLEEQTAYLAELDGSISAEEQQALDLLRRATSAIRAGKFDEVPPESGLPARPLAELNRLDPAATAAKLETPILVLQGGRDYQVTRADFELWQTQLAQRPDVTLRLLENLNHLFVSGSGKPTPQEYQQPGHVDSGVIDIIAAWIGTRASAP